MRLEVMMKNEMCGKKFNKLTVLFEEPIKKKKAYYFHFIHNNNIHIEVADQTTNMLRNTLAKKYETVNG